MIIYGFEFFHPLTGSHPETFPEYGKDIIARARKLLDKRAEGEIYQIISLINWLIDHSPAMTDLKKQLDIEIPDVEPDDATNKENYHLLGLNLTSPTYSLKAFQSKINMPLNKEIPNLTWPEVFAVLSLSLIDKAADDEKYYGGWAKDEETDFLHEWRIVFHASSWIIEAMEAVSTAEGFQQKEDQITDSKQKISIRNYNASLKKHTKTTKAVLAFHNFVNEGSYKSRRNAAQIFSEKFPELVNHLSPYNVVRTLSDALAKHLKGQRRSSQNIPI